MNTIEASRKNRKGFTIVELLAAVVVVLILASMAGPMFRTIIQNNRFRQDVADVENLLNRTMSEAMARGAVGQVAIVGNTIQGQVLGLDGVWIVVDNFTLSFSEFGRSEGRPTPWLNNTSIEPTSYDGNVISITATGVVDNSGAVFLNNNTKEASVELLVSGAVISFIREKGAAKWTQ